MPFAEEYDLSQVKKYSPQELELLSREKSSGVTNMLSEAYEWGKENKVAVGLAIGAVVLAGGLAKGVSRARANMAEMYGAPAETISTKSSLAMGDLAGTNAGRIPAAKDLKFVVHDDAVLGGRIGVEPKVSSLGDASGQHALNARLHEIPTFHDMPWDPLVNRVSATADITKFFKPR